MTIENILMQRSSAKCELCSSNVNLSVYDVLPNSGSHPNSSVLVCEKCLHEINNSAEADLKHWYCLNESMWSEFPAVQVLVFRILKSLGNNSWANDLLAQIYLDEETQKWADASAEQEAKTSSPVLDSNGNVIHEGDTVTLIKDLVVKGANFTAKRGTIVKNVSLTDDPLLIEGRVNGTRIVLVAVYLKKA